MLSSTSIVHTAVQMADEQGLDALTMRRLGDQMGVQAMALYRYVTGREDLLDAMVATMMAELETLLRSPTQHPVSVTTYLVRAARDVRDLALAHPWLVPLTVLRPPTDPALNPPLCGLACTDAVLSALAQHGYNAAASTRTYRAFCAFLLGHLLLEVRTPVHDPFPRQPVDSRRLDPVNQTRHPRLAGRVASLADTNYPAQFERSLKNFVLTLEPPRPN